MALYHSVKIGNLTLDGNLFLAPIAGYSDRAFRSLCVENGASYCTTEMVSAEALTRGSQKTAALMARAPSEKAYAVQIFGGNADVMAEAAKIVLETTECTSIDINGGCPVPKIIKSGAGS
ncbi:MAG: tRNA-dihydrouridine synthase, partial [Treponema sp.]|nr:tRNA-dihydrouridine synthase [Treponema sp.]